MLYYNAVSNPVQEKYILLKCEESRPRQEIGDYEKDIYTEKLILSSIRLCASYVTKESTLQIALASYRIKYKPETHIISKEM